MTMTTATAGRVRITMRELGSSGIATRDRTLMGASLQLLSVVDLLSFGALVDAGVRRTLSRADAASTEFQRLEIAASGGRVPLIGLSLRSPLVVVLPMTGATTSHVMQLVSRFDRLRREGSNAEESRLPKFAGRAIHEMVEEDAPTLRDHIAASAALQGLIERTATALTQVASAVPLEANDPGV